MSKKIKDYSIPPDYHRRASLAPIEVKRPERYLNASRSIKP